MEENKNNEIKVIDLYDIAKKIWKSRMLFAKLLAVTLICSSVFILGFPRYYNTEVKLAPEMENSLSGGTLSSIASSFGFDLDNFKSSDAITPLLYPDLMEDNHFVTNLFAVKIKTKEGNIETTYHDYLQKYRKSAWWTKPIGWIKNLFKKHSTKDTGFDPYNLSKEENDIVNLIQKNINIKMDKKTGAISINVEAQDPYVCKIVADSVQQKLQDFIIEYRTSKARNDYEYYLKLTKDAKQEYEKARQKYASMADANTHTALKSVELKLEDMENDLQLKFNTYTTINTQLQAAKAKVQERTPAFTTIKGASVPIKPAGPKRMIFVIICLFITFIGTTIYVNIQDIQRR